MKIVKYSATWCGPCKNFAPIAKAVSEELNIPMEEVDIDENPTEGIMSVPTTRLVDDTGNVIAEKSGGMPAPVFKAWIEENTPRF